MKCPSCATTDLMMTERSGIEIDYCPQCRGVWLDRGELDKLIERAGQQIAAAPPPPPLNQQPQHPQQPAYGRPMKPDDSHYGYQYGGKRKKSWFSEIFD